MFLIEINFFYKNSLLEIRKKNYFFDILTKKLLKILIHVEFFGLKIFQ